ncbi:MAG: secretin N-terminal domain-containing protein [Gammaproteobacteria bacterium]
MTALRRWVAFAILLLGAVSLPAVAADRIEIIPLKHRSAEEIMPLLRPLLDPNEALSGTGFQLIVRATPARHEELRRLVAQLDAAVRQLRISVRRAAWEEIERERTQARLVIGTDGQGVEARGRAIVRSTRDQGGERNHYQVTTLEGTPAFIHTGEAFPLPNQSVQIINGRPVVTQGIEYQSLASGFYALARTRDDEVIVDVSPQREVLDPHGSGHIQSTSLVTRVRGRLGEWLELGGTDRQQRHQDGGLLRSTRGRDDTQQTLWLKVDALE